MAKRVSELSIGGFACSSNFASSVGSVCAIRSEPYCVELAQCRIHKVPTRPIYSYLDGKHLRRDDGSSISGAQHRTSSAPEAVFLSALCRIPRPLRDSLVNLNVLQKGDDFIPEPILNYPTESIISCMVSVLLTIMFTNRTYCFVASRFAEATPAYTTLHSLEV